VQDPGYVLQQALAAESSPSTWQLLDKYAGHLRQQLIEAINHPQHKDKPLTGLKITVDAGNGSGGFFASKVGLAFATFSCVTNFIVCTSSPSAA
jgi:phosphomannomutase